MLSVLVLLVASSAFAAPGENRIDNSLVSRALSGFDDGDVNVNVLNIFKILEDLSRRGGNQELANGQTIAALGEIASGKAGCACAAADYVNAYTKYVASGNPAGVRESLGEYIKIINENVDNIVILATDKESARYKSGYAGGCPGEGRFYQFDAAWDIILGSYQNRLIDEEFCVAKRLYCGLSAVNNVVGAQVTASALPPTVQVFDRSSRQLTNFLQSLASRNNLGQSAASLKQALTAAVGRVTL